MMKQTILAIGLLVGASLNAFSCDQCSCASSGFMGIVPQFGKHYIGLRYQYQNFRTTHSSSIIEGLALDKSVEHFHTVEMFGSYVPHWRIQILASMPFQYRTQKSEQEGTFTGYGLGDAWLGVNYTVIKTPDTLGRKVRHNLILGAGLKTPTGPTNLKQDNELLNMNLQPGTGSWDPNFRARYIIRIKRWGISSAADFRLNTKNRNGYKFGNRVNSFLGAFYWTAYRSMTFIPQLAIMSDYAWKDRNEGVILMPTGGFSSWARANLQVGYKRLIFNAGYSFPLFHDLGSGEVSPKHQCDFSILILI
ncbi:MAG: hypothetical protein H6603_10730 [Flavobacteriales bacterium]|nr:hypothetical protein [Flavobacteriales bacterium]